jgi:hypothetical protein
VDALAPATDAESPAQPTTGRPGHATGSSRVVKRWSRTGYITGVTVPILTGLTWSVRAAQGVLFQPAYWDPSTLADYFAVYAFSAAWLLTAASLLILRMVAPAAPNLSTAIFVVAGACVIAGVANGIEDGLGAKWLGAVYATSAVVGMIGMFVVGRLLWTSPSRRLSFVPLAAGVTMAMVSTAVGALGFVPWLGLAAFIILARTASTEAGRDAPPPARP